MPMSTVFQMGIDRMVMRVTVLMLVGVDVHDLRGFFAGAVRQTHIDLDGRYPAAINRGDDDGYVGKS